MDIVLKNYLVFLLLGYCLTSVIKSDNQTSKTSKPAPLPYPLADEDEYRPAKSALNALDELMTFVFDGADQLNLDGLAGINIVAGQLRVLLRRVESIPADLRSDIQKTIAFSMGIIAKASPLIAASDPDYYEKLKFVLNETFFEHDYDLRATNKSLLMPSVTDVKSGSLNETFSDHCLSQLQGTGAVDGQSCFIPEECWNYMMSENRSGYFLTHQLLYLLFVESLNCEEQFANATETYCKPGGRCQTVPEVLEIMCSDVVREMRDLETNDFHGHKQDLYLEQVAICGILGFREVCTKRRLNRILSWQNPNGCYSHKDMPVLRRHRSKRYDAIFADGCSAHKTSVAAGALGVCIRIHVEDPSSN